MIIEWNGSSMTNEILASVVRKLSDLAQASGAMGQVGGIGARTVGLHEHLEAEALLRVASERGLPGAAERHSRCLGYLVSRAEPTGGFSPYPSGLPRVEYTGVRWWRCAAASMRARSNPTARRPSRAGVRMAGMAAVPPRPPRRRRLSGRRGRSADTGASSSSRG